MQMVSITLRVLSRPDVEHLPKIYQNLGLDYDERVLPSIGNEVLKAIVAQFDAAELITQREVVSSRIREDLLQRAGEFNIKLEDVSITHLTFGKVRDFPSVEREGVANCAVGRNSHKLSRRSRSRSKTRNGPSLWWKRRSRSDRRRSSGLRARPRLRRRSRRRWTRLGKDSWRSVKLRRARRLCSRSQEIRT